MSVGPSVVHILYDKQGGVFSLHANLLRYRPRGSLPQHVILMHGRLEQATRSTESLVADTQQIFEHCLPLENLHAVLRRLRSAIPRGPGVLIVTDQQEMGLLHVWKPTRTVVQIVHDAYNLELAHRHCSVIDIFIAHSRYFYDRLRELLPHRHAHIFHIRYGVPLSPKMRQAAPGPLRLAFLGRMTNAKGIFDLPVIDNLLRDSGVGVSWTVIGDGPERETLIRTWGASNHVRFLRPKSNAEVIDLLAECDVLVFPTRFEGFPVALLEAMGAGLVPVVTDLPSGVPEVVSSVTGYRLPMGDCASFAHAVAELAHDRDRLEVMSGRCRSVVEEEFEVSACVREYHALFARHEEHRQPSRTRAPLPYGSRLDQTWLPNAVVYPIRAGIRLMKGQRIR